MNKDYREFIKFNIQLLDKQIKELKRRLKEDEGN